MMVRTLRISWPALLLFASLSSCRDKEAPSGSAADASLEAGAGGDAGAPGASLDLDGGASDAEVVVKPPVSPCPADMVRVADRFCVDRYETSLVDVDTEQGLSPYYPLLKSSYEKYIEARQAESTRLLEKEPTGMASSMTFPPLPSFQRRGRFTARAVSVRGVTPNGYLSMATSRDACAAAGKRLCTLEEWQTACRGQEGRQFPYGDAYKQGTCNVFREDHPGRVLFENMTVGMIDPRMNKVTVKGKPLLRLTGGTAECKSVWGDDAIYDMVGNLDEWVDDPEGTFAGGFFSRASKVGCDRVVTAHPALYFDYSTGGRCCQDP